MKNLFFTLKQKRFLILKENIFVQNIITALLSIFSLEIQRESTCLSSSTHKQKPQKTTFIKRIFTKKILSQIPLSQILLSQILLGMVAALLFWSAFWGFMLVEILPLWLNFILSFLCYTGIFLLLFWLKIKKNISLSYFRLFTYSSESFPFQFLCCLILSIILFSFLHKNYYFLVSLCYPIAIVLFLFFPRQYRFWFGFFVGVFGFYWMTLSFRFENLEAIIPLAIIGIGIIYGIFFWFLLYFNNAMYRILAIASLFVLYPTGFNWLNIAYLSSYSVFNSSFLGLMLLAFAFYFAALQSSWRFLSIILLLCSLDYNFRIQTPELHAKIIQTNYSQNQRWQKENIPSIIAENIAEIEQASLENYPIIILPETSFPFVLSSHTELYQTLLEMSEKIIIFAGGIRFANKLDSQKIPTNALENSLFIPLDVATHYEPITSAEESFRNKPSTKSGYYNTTFIFANGKSIIADKVALVPFGETPPLQTITKPILESFGIKMGFDEGKEIVTLEYNGLKIANANCYEGTMDLPYKSGAKYVIVTSNNAWFSPSTQYFMQQMIMKYYAKSYNAFVYHATNLTPKAILTPNNGNNGDL